MKYILAIKLCLRRAMIDYNIKLFSIIDLFLHYLIVTIFLNILYMYLTVFVVH